jgi:hypothetical protein
MRALDCEALADHGDDACKLAVERSLGQFWDSALVTLRDIK